MSGASPLVSTEWLAQRLSQPDIRIADASWYLPQAGRQPRAEYEAAHIPGAVFFDLDALSDRNTDLPHMLPDAGVFARDMGALGIGDDDTIVFYDGAGIYSAPRALWMMRAMGHEKAFVVDGGLPKWRREGRPLGSSAPRIVPQRFTPRLRPNLLRDFKVVRANLTSQREQVLDARSPSRFRGEEAEPRSGVRAGHMPGAINIHYAEVVGDDGTLRKPADLVRIFDKHGVDLKRPIVTSCGSGITAAILTLALDIAGAKETSLYDGSWAEWGARPDAPVETGPSR